MPVLPAPRRTAHSILLSIELGNAHSDDLLRAQLAMAKMTDADRRLATTLVLGVLRWQLQLDQNLRSHLSKPNTKLDPAVLVALRLGAFQLLHLDRIPAHAAINESVEIVKQSGYRSAAGLVNAVLRKIAAAASQTRAAANSHDVSPAETAENTSGNPIPEKSCSDALAAHPAWITKRWTEFFGRETACAICLHNQHPPSTAIRLSSPAAEQELVQSGVTLALGKLLSAARIVVSGEVAATAAFRESHVGFQDEGSQLVGEIAAHSAHGVRKILDCCAAPGGKTLILAERNQAAHIVACEASPQRLKQLQMRLAGLANRIECRLADATALDFDADFDLVLADVPCSGTGTLSRNPEIRHRLQPGDLARHSERQRAILSSALRAVRPGGRVVYSTCSLEPEENEDVIRAVVSHNQNACMVALGSMVNELHGCGILTEDGADALQHCLTPEGFLRLMPGAFGTDGFFVAILEKS